MDTSSFMIVAITGMFIILFVAIRRQTPSFQAKHPSTKKQEILDGFKAHLCQELAACNGDVDAQRRKRTELLKLFTKKLSLNVFFDQQSLHQAIEELAAWDCSK